MFYFKFFLRELQSHKADSFGLILNYKMENDNEKISISRSISIRCIFSRNMVVSINKKQLKKLKQQKMQPQVSAVQVKDTAKDAAADVKDVTTDAKDTTSNAMADAKNAVADKAVEAKDCGSLIKLAEAKDAVADKAV